MDTKYEQCTQQSKGEEWCPQQSRETDWCPRQSKEVEWCPQLSREAERLPMQKDILSRAGSQSNVRGRARSQSDIQVGVGRRSSVHCGARWHSDIQGTAGKWSDAHGEAMCCNSFHCRVERVGDGSCWIVNALYKIPYGNPGKEFLTPCLDPILHLPDFLSYESQKFCCMHRLRSSFLSDILSGGSCNCRIF